MRDSPRFCEGIRPNLHGPRDDGAAGAKYRRLCCTAPGPSRKDMDGALYQLAEARKHHRTRGPAVFSTRKDHINTSTLQTMVSGRPSYQTQVVGSLCLCPPLAPDSARLTCKELRESVQLRKGQHSKRRAWQTCGFPDCSSQIWSFSPRRRCSRGETPGLLYCSYSHKSSSKSGVLRQMP